MATRSSTAPPIRVTRPSHSPFNAIQRRSLTLFAALVLLGTAYSLAVHPASETALRTRSPASLHAQLPEHVVGPYFASKRNIFNQWFVKKAWGWTTIIAWAHLAAGILAALEIDVPLASLTGRAVNPGLEKKKMDNGATSSVKPAASTTSPANTQDLANTIASVAARPLLRWILATSYWLLFTRWFFGPSFSERVLVLTGGQCSPAAGSPSLSGLEHNLEAALCRAGTKLAVPATGSSPVAGVEGVLGAAGGRPYWRGGHDVSGHVFLLIHASIYLISAVGPVLPYLFGDPRESPLVKENSRQRRTRPTALQRATAWAVLAFVALWSWMLLMTSVYFHTPLEKLSGLVVALGGVAVQAIAN